MKIEKWSGPDEQFCRIGKNKWRCARLFELIKSLPILDVPIDYININEVYDEMTIRQLIMHMKTVNDADLSFPIILDEDGDLMDGRHRIMKALLTGAKTIKAVRFEDNPSPCKIHED